MVGESCTFLIKLTAAFIGAVLMRCKLNLPVALGAASSFVQLGKVGAKKS